MSSETMTTIKTYFTDLPSDAALVARTVHKETFIQPFSETFDSTVTIVISFVAIACIHMVFLRIVKSNQNMLQLTNPKEVQKAAYQFTNMLVNFTLGITGLYTIYNAPDTFALIFPSNEPDLLQRITGYGHLTHFCAYQLGYNLWALPVGVLIVDENPVMILHHISVLSSTVLACYTNIRYTIYAAYIFGLAELSSVPLAIMNLLKERSEWTKKNFATGFAIVKVCFATSFLTLRIGLATPMIMDLTRSSFLVLSTMTFWKQEQFIDGSESIDTVKIVICGFNFVLMCCLGFLQVSYEIKRRTLFMSCLEECIHLLCDTQHSQNLHCFMVEF